MKYETSHVSSDSDYKISFNNNSGPNKNILENDFHHHKKMISRIEMEPDSTSTGLKENKFNEEEDFFEDISYSSGKKQSCSK